MSLTACITIAIAIAMILWRLPKMRGTTLIGPAAWLLVALVAIGAFEWMIAQGHKESESGSLRLLLASVTLCPAISLIGAKRPQDKAWHFIVASLWIVISLPGIQALISANGESPETHPAREWFLLGLLAFAVMNSIFSKYWYCILLAGFGSAILLSPFLPYPFETLSGVDLVWGATSYSWAAILAVISSYRSRRSTSPIDSVWKDFRDAFGLLWTLRIAERMTATAQANGWNVAVSWQGVQISEMSDNQSRLFRQNLSNLLRRFVNDEWIAKRLGPRFSNSKDESHAEAQNSESS